MSTGKFVTVFLIAAGLSILPTGPAAAEDSTEADASATNAGKKDTSRRVCRSVTPTGSRFTRRVCKTSEQWQKDSERAQRVLEDSFRSIVDPAGAAAHAGGSPQ